jgi:hypothetical protein
VYIRGELVKSIRVSMPCFVTVFLHFLLSHCSRLHCHFQLLRCLQTHYARKQWVDCVGQLADSVRVSSWRQRKAVSRKDTVSHLCLYFTLFLPGYVCASFICFGQYFCDFRFFLSPSLVISRWCYIRQTRRVYLLFRSVTSFQSHLTFQGAVVFLFCWWTIFPLKPS